ncbi:hypothetical protein VPNG_09579 [Cytospora leucostoma]|uniref:Ketoreductase (KR) domain-containing protein n=1 Tax=Cytospora leucostoma TaxID=1230097 RepID=A0A423VN63_9PEZI|nr:hypothetical protein VPNG_09579 [Cytospora leucostoma]
MISAQPAHVASTSPKIIFVTGANQGLGLAIIQVAALRDPEPIYVLASRKRLAGEEAAEKLRELGVTAKIEVVELDVTNDEQIEAAVNLVKTKFGKLDDPSSHPDGAPDRGTAATVLINNAGISGPMRPPTSESLSETRARYNTILDTNLTSVAVLTRALTPALHRSPAPKVINVSSGLGSMSNALARKMGRAPAYGASKVGLNGLSVHLQVEENDRVEAGISVEEPRIKTFVVAPGLLRTSFTGFSEKAKDPKDGAEAIVRLALEEVEFEGGSFLEWADGKLKRVPW